MRWEIALLLPLMLTLAVPPLGMSAEPESAETERTPSEHPLRKLVALAEEREREIRSSIRDYTCLLVKRERISGVLQPHRFIDVKVRAEQQRSGQKVPMAVRMHFLAPREVKDRLVLYVEGQNDGQMAVRRGGPRFSFVTVNVNPNSELAQTESLMKITHMGLGTMVGEIIRQVKKHIQADPLGTNTQVEVVEDAAINGRACTYVQITHPQRQADLDFYRARLFVDNEHRLPVRVESYDWPKTPESEPDLLGEFTYTKVRINVGLTDADFDFAQLQSTEASP
jgi:hypothetical protein